MTAERYEVRVTPLVGVVKVEAVLIVQSPHGLSQASQWIRRGLYLGGDRPPLIYVWPPNWWERWWGVTWAQKVERAKARVERWARERGEAFAAACAVVQGERGGGGRCQPPTKS